MIATENREWGFFGTARRQGGENFAQKAWEVAFEHIDILMGWGESMTRDFLDSRCGRHYADKMAESGNWREAITRYCHAESECRAFFKEVDPLGYKSWSQTHGRTLTERTMRCAKINTDDILSTVRNLTGMDYNKLQIECAIKAASPLAMALALILADMPEDVRNMYTATEDDLNSREESSSSPEP